VSLSLCDAADGVAIFYRVLNTMAKSREEIGYLIFYFFIAVILLAAIAKVIYNK